MLRRALHAEVDSIEPGEGLGALRSTTTRWRSTERDRFTTDCRR